MRLSTLLRLSFFSLLSTDTTLAQTSSSPTLSVSKVQDSTYPTAAQTCRSGSVNYITRTLPQQCVAGNRTAATRSATEARETSGGTASASTTFSGNTQSITGSTVDIAAASVSVSQTAVPSAESFSSTTEAPSTRVPTSSTSTGAATEDSDADSPLDTANFLSFEEWKKQNLAKIGQSPEHVGQHRSPDDKPRRPRPGINNALDVLGEDSEIELDFTGFGAATSAQPPNADSRAQGQSGQDGTSLSERPPPSQQSLRSKDAGRTCKERTNYASFDCAATVLKTNKECKSASSVLVENKDSYMLNICTVKNKFFIVELCDDILIDTVVLANYEFFSSIFRTFRLSVSDRYPAKADKWRELGIFEARNTRDVQAFLVEQPLIWARYLRIEILSHYGNEYYCPVSLLRVHGTTMLEEFRHQEDISRGDYAEEIGAEETETQAQSSIVAQEPTAVSIEADKSVSVMSIPTSETRSSSSQETAVGENGHTPAVAPSSTATFASSHEPTASSIASHNRTVNSISEVGLQSYINVTAVGPESRPTTTSWTSNHTRHDVLNATETTDRASTSLSSSSIHPEQSTSASTQDKTATAYAQSNGSRTTTASSRPIPPTISNTSISTADARPPEKQQSTTVAPSNPQQPSRVLSSNAGHSDSNRRPSNTVGNAPPVPSTQESFFKSIHKRLQMLESNATLSLQYIEEQSRILRDAFSKVEKRQIKKTETFLNNLNATVNSELQDFRRQYDQLWQSTVIELDNHRQQYQQEILAVSARLNIVAEELLFQKRMVIVQSTLLMLCLGLVLFSRTGNNALDIPLVQQMMNKSPLMSRASFYSPPHSPSMDGSSPPNGDMRRRSLWRRSVSPGLQSDPSADDLSVTGKGPDLRFQAATPNSPQSLASEAGSTEGHVGDDDDDGDTRSSGGESSGREEPVGADDRMVNGEGQTPKKVPLETQSGPATPTGTRDTGLVVGDGLLSNGIGEGDVRIV